MSTRNLAAALPDAEPVPAAGIKRALKVFIVDDFPVVRAGLRSLIDAQPDMQVVGEAPDGEKAWERVRVLARQQVKREGKGTAAVDVIVMDDAMPNIDGAEATSAIRQAYPEIKVLAYAMHEDPKTLRELLSAGATGCVLKRSQVEHLLTAIRTIASGQSYLDPALTNNVIHSLTQSTPPESEAGIPLSEREQQTLRSIALGFSNAEIAGQLRLSVKTIESFKARGMKKLELTTRSDILRHALERDWL